MVFSLKKKIALKNGDEKYGLEKFDWFYLPANVSIKVIAHESK